MLAAVLTMLWRQVPSVQELTRMLAREDLLWCKAVQVSQQAVSQRFVSFPFPISASQPGSIPNSKYICIKNNLYNTVILAKEIR